MRAIIVAFAALIVIAAPSRADACGEALTGAETLASNTFTVAFRTQPAKIAVGQHFAVELVVCAKNPGESAKSVKVDAHMPEHRHGMNYKPRLTALGDGRYEAQGLMFHMPGRWEFLFDIEGAAGSERLVHSMVLR